MFNGPQLTKEVRELILDHQFDEVEARIYQDLNEFPQGEKTRLRQLRRLYNSVKQQLKRPLQEDETRISLKRHSKVLTHLDSLPEDIQQLSDGFYSVGQAIEMPDTFNTTFTGYSDHFIQALMTSRFNTPIETGNHDSFGLIRDVTICGHESPMNAYAFNGDEYLNEESARIAKALAINTHHRPQSELDFALLLPIPHIPDNYYHVLSEMVYGLRFARHLPDDTHIIYQQDHYGILMDMVKRMGINENRLMSFNEAKQTHIQRALLPGLPPYYWNRGFYEFFVHITGNQGTKTLKVYLSRALHQRGPDNEKALEDALIEKGYLIVYPEKLTFSQQVELFTHCCDVVTPHGAGITNIAFMPGEARLIELFPDNMLQRDFYMRSRHNNMEYRAMTYDREIDIEALLSQLDS